MIVRLEATEFCPSSPAVMLSPNARNDVVDNLDGLVTVTVNAQLSVRCRASVAAQVTVFCPIENGDPATGVQVVLTGACPFDTIGALKVTGVAPPSTDCAVCAAGQLIFGGSGVIGTGVGTWVGVVVPPHAVETIAPATARTRRSPHLHTKTH
jgi:hypothetical protein